MTPRSIASSARPPASNNWVVAVAAATAMKVCGNSTLSARTTASNCSERANGVVSIARIARGGCRIASLSVDSLSFSSRSARRRDLGRAVRGAMALDHYKDTGSLWATPRPLQLFYSAANLLRPRDYCTINDKADKQSCLHVNNEGSRRMESFVNPAFLSTA